MATPTPPELNGPTTASPALAAPAPPAPLPPTPHPDSMLPPGREIEMPVDFTHHHVSFWRQQWVQNVLPFATSLILHVSLIVVGWLLLKELPKVIQVVQEQIIIPEATLAENGPPGGIEHPGLGGDPTRDAAQDLVKDTPQEGLSNRASDQLNQAVLGGAAGEEDASSITIGANASTGGKGNGIGSGSEGGQLSSFGMPGGGGGIGPKSSFVGVGGNARKIIYFCDASGSMVPVFGQLRFELKKSIDALKAVQAFNVVFFRDDKYEAVSHEGLIMASPDNKRKSYDFIDGQVSAGVTAPIAAIKFALAQKPELMFLLTDGFDNIANFDELIQTFKAGNPDRKIHVNCIFLKSSDDPKLESVLRQIAKDNGGLMKVIAKSEF